MNWLQKVWSAVAGLFKKAQAPQPIQLPSPPEPAPAAPPPAAPPVIVQPVPAPEQPKPSPVDPNLKLLEVASKYLGVRETSPNHGPVVDKFIIDMEGRQTGESWCMDFVQYCIKETASKLGLKSQLTRSPSTRSVWENSPKSARLKSPEPGCVVIWQHGKSWQGHTGFVTKILKSGNFLTIEGNTGSGMGVVRDGDGVYERERSLAGSGDMHILGFLRVFS